MAFIRKPPGDLRNRPAGRAGSKADSRFNAAKKGVPAKTLLTFDESPEAYARLAAEYHEQFQPANPAQQALVEILINSEWTLRRLRSAEVGIWEQVSDKLLAGKGPGGAVTSGETFAAASEPFVRLQQVIERSERNYFRAAKELERLQAPLKQPNAGARRSNVLQFPKPAKPIS